MRYITIILVMLAGSLPLSGQNRSPFSWQLRQTGDELEVLADIPAGHYLYEEQTSVEATAADGTLLEPLAAPLSVLYDDEYAGKTGTYQPPRAIWRFRLTAADQLPVEAKIRAQGCRTGNEETPSICFMPETFTLRTNGLSPVATVVTDNGSAASLFSGYSVVRSAGGFMNATEFRRFIHGVSAPGGFRERGIVAMILLIILGGLGLNLTPCVLPMIPINLAIIGAGRGADSKSAGFLRGGLYGAGMALAYGILGIVTVLTGARFGTLNSSAWFNFTIAGIFVVLALAMFGVFNLDFSRYSAGIKPRNMEKGRLAAVFFLGVMAALLAGACVAPVVLAVLVYSAQIYAAGYYSAILLPLLLGIGMALPWPAAGAGLSVLPRPGRWMVMVKYAFAVIILIFAAYYGYTGWRNLPLASRQQASRENISKLREQLDKARAENRGVIIDFWASWCKSCLEMDRTTLKDPEIVDMLRNFEFIKFQAEDLSEPGTRAILNYFDATGLPYFVILRPE